MRAVPKDNEDPGRGASSSRYKWEQGRAVVVAASVLSSRDQPAGSPSKPPRGIRREGVGWKPGRRDMDMAISPTLPSEASHTTTRGSWSFDYMNRRVGPGDMLSTLLPLSEWSSGACYIYTCVCISSIDLRTYAYSSSAGTWYIYARVYMYNKYNIYQGIL